MYVVNNARIVIFVYLIKPNDTEKRPSNDFPYIILLYTILQVCIKAGKCRQTNYSCMQPWSLTSDNKTAELSTITEQYYTELSTITEQYYTELSTIILTTPKDIMKNGQHQQ